MFLSVLFIMTVCFFISYKGENPYMSKRKCSILLNLKMGETPKAKYSFALKASLKTMELCGVGVKAGACKIEAV